MEFYIVWTKGQPPKIYTAPTAARPGEHVTRVTTPEKTV